MLRVLLGLGSSHQLCIQNTKVLVSSPSIHSRAYQFFYFAVVDMVLFRVFVLPVHTISLIKPPNQSILMFGAQSSQNFTPLQPRLVLSKPYTCSTSFKPHNNPGRQGLGVGGGIFMFYSRGKHGPRSYKDMGAFCLGIGSLFS